MIRFTGSVEAFTSVNVAEIVDWLSSIDLRAWPQQSLRELKPAMVTDPGWFGFGTITAPLVAELMVHFPGCSAYNEMLSAVMPGHCIEPHTDSQAPYWLCRVHCPLTSNDKSSFIVDGMPYHMEVGTAYRVNVLREHSVTNDGATPRIHFMTDIRREA